jgi:hypothetical protein
MVAIISGGLKAFKVDGVQLMVRGSVKIKPASVKNTTIVNADGSVVYSVMPVAPALTLVISDWGGAAISSVTSIFGKTLQVSLTNGKSFTFTAGTYVDEGELNTEDGSFSASFSASDCDEQVVKS